MPNAPRPTLIGVAPPKAGSAPGPTRSLTPTGRYRLRTVEVRETGAPSAVDRKLRATADEAGKGYDLDARAIAKTMVRHYGDEAEMVLKRVALFLDEARKAKR